MWRNRFILIFIIILTIYSFTYASDVDPYVLRIEALKDFDKGNVEEAQKKLIEAGELFEEQKNWDMLSMCLYERVIEYMNVGDLLNMGTLMKDLQMLNEAHPSALVAYNYHSVASGYYSYIEDSVDLAFQHGWGAIQGLENIEDPYVYKIVPVWSYYNMAVMYDLYSQPPLVDSIRYYLNKSREILQYSRTPKDSIEGMISVLDLEAWLEYYEKNYKKAEQMMLDVLMMIDYVSKLSPNTVISERGEAYKFLAMIYDEQGIWDKAYTYQQKLTANNEERYNLDKRRVLQEVQTQYDVAKQQLEMEKLEAENKSSRWLLVALWLLLVVLMMGYWLLAMRRKNTEAKLYEAALEADNMRQAIVDLESQTDIEPLRLLVDSLLKQLDETPSRPYTKSIILALRALDLNHIQVLISHGNKLTTMDRRYILCFAAGMNVEQIAEFMSLEPASVYTVRYRLRKKFSSEYPFPY